MTIYTKLIFILNISFIKIPVDFFAKIYSLVQTAMWKCKEPMITKTILKKKHKPGGHTLSYFKTYYEVTVIKTVWRKKEDNLILA